MYVLYRYNEDTGKWEPVKGRRYPDYSEAVWGAEAAMRGDPKGRYEINYHPSKRKATRV